MAVIASELEDDWEEAWKAQREIAIENYRNACALQDDGECLLKYGALLAQIRKEKWLKLNEEVRDLKHSVVNVPTVKEKKQILQVKIHYLGNV